MELSSRIKEYRGFHEWTQDDLAKASGLSLSIIKKYESGAAENFTYENLKKISSAFNVKPSDFIDEDFTVNVSVNNQQNVRQSVRQSQNLSANQDGFKGHELEQLQRDQIFIRQLSSNVGAGESVDIDGVEVYDTEVLIPFSKMLFRLKPDVEKLRCMRVSGYSMIPMLYPDSWVIADINKEFKGDGLYIINYSGNFMVKLLQKAPDGTLEIISINKEYKSYEIGPNDDTQAYIIGKVLRCVI
ncbi:XRE family transcriptional regulator [Campylobacter curvus]|uniref:XRE family transcriptional regulator n=1 Tax=Campylobacter curvus TaxID=200 RepID=UPI00146FDF72|nr:S24 family peptidase [Campylobacter curvus]